MVATFDLATGLVGNVLRRGTPRKAWWELDSLVGDSEIAEVRDAELTLQASEAMR